MRADKLYLVGFMGAGKTTVARALGRRIGWRVEDIDTRIEARERRTVAAIFAKDGEGYFREAEKAMLHELQPERNLIVATGGGTFVDADNRAMMLADGAVAMDRLYDSTYKHAARRAHEMRDATRQIADAGLVAGAVAPERSAITAVPPGVTPPRLAPV